MTLKTFLISSLITFGLSFAIGYWFFAQKDADKTQPSQQPTPGQLQQEQPAGN